MTEFLRMSGIYWGVTALELMDNSSKIDQASIVEFVKKCQCPVSGGISPCEGHDPHILYTLSAIQVGLSWNLRFWVPVILCKYTASPRSAQKRRKRRSNWIVETPTKAFLFNNIVTYFSPKTLTWLICIHRFCVFTIVWKRLTWKQLLSTWVAFSNPMAASLEINGAKLIRGFLFVP